MKPSKEQKQLLTEATARYRATLPKSPAESFLNERGLTLEDVAPFHLGYVEDPITGHEMYRGWLAIPYLRWSPGHGGSVVNIRFRCLRPNCEHNGHGKYMSAPGYSTRLYNPLAMLESHDAIAISEGEIDTISATVCGVPTVGVPGVKSWQPYYRELFEGYENVFILADGDRPGMEFAEKLANELRNARIIPSGPGEDVNSEMIKLGRDFLKERIAR